MVPVDFLASLRAYGYENEVPNVSPTMGRLLHDLVLTSGATRILELGTANGYSTIWMASALRALTPALSQGERGQSCKLITVDVSEPSYKQAIDNIAEVGLSDYVELNFGNALEFVPNLPDDSFDFAFIDARKKWTKEFLRLTWPKVKSGGIIIIDDVIKFKEKMAGFYEYLEEQGIVYNVLPIDEDDGCMMIVKS